MNNPDAGKQCHVCKEPWRTQHLLRNRRLLPLEVQVQSVPCQISYHLQDSMIFTVGESRVSTVSKTENTRYLLVDSGALRECGKARRLFRCNIDSTKARPLFSVPRESTSSAWEAVYPAVQLGRLKGKH